MNPIEKLTQIFSQFPGIGPRQAKRFVYYLLTRANGTLSELAENIKDLKNEVAMCSDCHRFFTTSKSKQNSTKGGVADFESNLCNICTNQDRDRSLLMIVQRDIDLESVERNGGYNGIYFVLGGSVPILEKEPEKRIRLNELKKFMHDKLNPTSQSFAGLKEIILGVNWNPEGENTGDFVQKFLKPLTEKTNIKITHLGKGLSMGSELEYTDPDTLKNALKNRA